MYFCNPLYITPDLYITSYHIFFLVCTLCVCVCHIYIYIYIYIYSQKAGTLCKT